MNTPHHLYEIAKLALIFGFVIVIVAIRSWRRIRQQKLWHETLRLSLEKGQPLPPDALSYGAGGGLACGRGLRGRPWCDIRRGLIWIAAGLALYYALPGEHHVWSLVPMFVGAAFLVCGLIGILRSDNTPDQKDPSAKT